MSENLALSELAKKLEQSKKQELDQIKQIEAESMSELAKSLKRSLQIELSSIEDDITKMQEGIIKNNKTLAENTENYSEEIVQSFQNMSQELAKLKVKQWIIPTVMGLALVLAIALGTWGVTKYLSSQVLALQELRGAEKAIKNYKPVLKIWGNGIEIKKGYRAKLEKTEEGTYFLRLEE